jgi:hypothetical protein
LLPNSKSKIYSLVGYGGHAFDGIVVHETDVAKLIQDIEKGVGSKVVAIKVNKENVELLLDRPITKDGVKAVKIIETEIDRTGIVAEI